MPALTHPQAKFVTAFLLSVLAVFAPIKPMMLAALGLTLADALTGVWAARRRGEPITSSGFRRTVGKLLVYQMGLVVGLIAQQYLVPDVPIVKLVAGTVGVTEFKSIMENLESITGQPLLKVALEAISARPAPKD